MAVQKSKKSTSRRDMRRSHDALTSLTLSTDPVSGELHRRHHITDDGYYRGRKVLITKDDSLDIDLDDEDDEDDD